MSFFLFISVNICAAHNFRLFWIPAECMEVRKFANPNIFFFHLHLCFSYYYTIFLVDLKRLRARAFVREPNTARNLQIYILAFFERGRKYLCVRSALIAATCWSFSPHLCANVNILFCVASFVNIFEFAHIASTIESSQTIIQQN